MMNPELNNQLAKARTRELLATTPRDRVTLIDRMRALSTR